MDGISYNWFMDNIHGPLAEYFERNILKYQMIHGRMSLEKIAEPLHFTRGYLSQLLDGKRTSMSFHAAVYVAVVFDDYSILEILDYVKPDDDTIRALALASAATRAALMSSLAEVSAKGMAFDSEESVDLIVSTLKDAGIKIKANSEPLSSK